MIIEPDFPSDFIGDPKQVNNTPSVSFFDVMPFIATQNNQRLEVHVNEAHPELPLRPMQNFLRFRCAGLPSHAAVEISMSVFRSVGKDDIPLTEVQKVNVYGKFRGLYRNESINDLAHRASSIVTPE
jgi:hypothetical protein